MSSERDKAIATAIKECADLEAQGYGTMTTATHLFDAGFAYHAKQNAEVEKLDIDITTEDIRKVPSGDPAQWEIALRELCQEIEKLPASEQQTAISVKASTISQSLAEFNRYCDDEFEEMKKARPDLFGKQAEGGEE